MSKQTNKSYDLEEALKVHFQSPEPSPEFVRSLEMQLKGVEQVKEAGFITRIFGTRRIRRALAPIALALAMTIVPGVGFVDVNTARILGEPLQQTKDDVTLTVKQVLANADDTFVVISMDIFPTYEEIQATLGPLTEENRFEWIDRSMALWDTQARLILDDGSVLESWNFSGSYWDGYFSFPALPEGTLTLELEIDRIPGIPVGMAPGNWRFAVELLYAADPQELDLPETTAVEVTSEILHGVSLQVLDVVYAPSEISIRVQFEDIPVGWQSTFRNLDGRLYDDLGNEYTIVYGPNSGVSPSGIYTMSFRPLLADASELTLSVVNLPLTVNLESQSITIDFGTDLQVGDRIELDQTIDVLGLPVRFAAVTVREGDVASFVDANDVAQQIPMISYDFEIISLPIVNGLGVSGLELAPDVFTLMGEASFGSGSSGGRLEDDGTFSYTLTIGIPADHPLVSGIITLPFEKADVSISGPFTVDWVVE
jgi:hypothetical protein